MSSCQPASSAPLLPLLAPQLNSIEISQAMNIFALLVPLPSPPHPLHPFPLPGIAFCQCIDPTCILWSKLAFDIYAGCQADGQRLKILPLLSPSLSPATPLDHCHQRELDKEREGEKEWGRGSLVHLCLLLSLVCSVFVFLCVSHSAFFPAKFACKTIDTRVAVGVWGSGLNLFGNFSCHRNYSVESGKCTPEGVFILLFVYLTFCSSVADFWSVFSMACHSYSKTDPRPLLLSCVCVLFVCVRSLLIKVYSSLFAAASVCV